MESNSQERNRRLLIIAGHAIYQQHKWHGGQPDEDRFYEQHIRDGFQIWRSEAYQALAFSGGHTRPREPVTKSEAKGMLEFARDAELCVDEADILVESFARDNFENVLFPILAFFS